MLSNKIIFYSVFHIILHYISSLPKPNLQHCDGHMTQKTNGVQHHWHRTLLGSLHKAFIWLEI